MIGGGVVLPPGGGRVGGVGVRGGDGGAGVSGVVSSSRGVASRLHLLPRSLSLLPLELELHLELLQLRGRGAGRVDLPPRCTPHA